MAGSSPTITAMVTAEDKASAVLRAVAQLSSRVASEIEKTGHTRAFSGLPSQLDAATLAANRHVAALHRIRDAFKGVTGLAATYAASRFPHIAGDAIRNYMPLERETIAQQAAGKFSDTQMKILRDQQTMLAERYGEKPEAVIHAQGEFVKRHMDAATTAAMTEEATKLAKALGTSVQKGAQILEGMIFGTGHHVTNPEEAHRLGSRMSDIAATQAKKGAMSAEDIEAGWKYSAAATTASGISPEQAAAVQMVLKREQFGGDESGVFLRQLGARLMMPTNEGRIALQAAGIQLDQYIGPGVMRAGNLNLSLAERSLKELPKADIDAIQKKYEQGAFKTKADFGRAIRDAYEKAYSDTSAKDLNVVGNVAGRFFEASKGQVDGKRLWDTILHQMSPQQILEFLGVKQGAKGVSAIQQLQVTKDYEDALSNNQGEAARLATERMKGLAAAVDRLKTTYENTSAQIVAANSGWLTKVANMGTAALSAVSKLSDTEKQMATAGGAFAALAGGAWGVLATLNRVKSFLGLAVPEAAGGAAAATGGAGGAAATAGGVTGGGLLAAGIRPLFTSLIGEYAGAALASTVAGAAITAGEAAALGYFTYKGLGGGQSDVQNELTRHLVELNARLNTLEHVAQGRESRGEDASATRAKIAQLQADLERLQSYKRRLDTDEQLPAFAGGAMDRLRRFMLPKEAAQANGGDNFLASLPPGWLGRASTPQETNVAVSVSGDVTGQAEIVSKVDVQITGLDKAVGHAISRLQMPLSGKLGQTMKGSNAAVGSVGGSGMFKTTISGH